jgi:hypothetical protein
MVDDGGSFSWPNTYNSIEVPAGKTITIVSGVWEIPDNITLEFDAQDADNAAAALTTKVIASVRVLGTVKYKDALSIASANVTLAKSSKIVCTNTGNSYFQVNDGYTLSVEKDADLSLDVVLKSNAILTGEGTVSGAITVNNYATISGSLNCTGLVTVKESAILTIPKDSKITMSCLCVDKGTVKLYGTLSLAGGGAYDHSIDNDGYISVEADSVLELLENANLVTSGTSVPLRGTGKVSLVGAYDTATEKWSGPSIDNNSMEQLLQDETLLSNYVGKNKNVDSNGYCNHAFTMEVIKAATHYEAGEQKMICGTCGYSYTKEIAKLTGGTDISTLVMTLAIPEAGYTYDGTEKKPAVSVVNGNTTLPATSYEAVYENNVNVGTATVTVTGNETSGFYGTLKMEFTISTVTLADANVTLSKDSVSYDGKEQKPEVTVTVAGNTLKEGTDYAVSYTNNTNVGTATVTVYGINNCAGTVTKTFTIKEASNNDSNGNNDSNSNNDSNTTPGGTDSSNSGSDNSSIPGNSDDTNNQDKTDVANPGNDATGNIDIENPSEGDIGVAAPGTSDDTNTNTIAIGTKYTIAGYKYKVTGASTVAFIGLKNKSIKSVIIPKKVTIDGQTFKVTAIAAKALKGTKVKQVKIGANVKKINTAAFKNCKNLVKIKIISKKLKVVKKNALKGINSSAKIRVPASKLAAYKKLLKGKGQASTVKISKYF